MERDMRNLIRVFGIAALIPVCFLSLRTASAQEIQKIRPQELKRLIEDKADMLVVDTQPPAAYEMGHIQGAINFPWARELKGPGNLPYNKRLILYCDCGNEEDSIDVARQLITNWEWKPNSLCVLEGGWSKWIELGYPIEKGK
jgi:rhodanese-related sulfurtransferase